MKMKLLCILLSTCIGYSAEVTNPDKPIRGDWDLKPVKLWKIENFNDQFFSKDTGRIRVDRNGDLFLFDAKACNFHVFSSSGKWLRTFGRRGEGPGEITRLLNFHLTPSYLMACDQSRLHILKKDGSHVRSEILPHDITPTVFLDDDRLLSAPATVGPDPSAKQAVKTYNLMTKESSIITEFTPNLAGISKEKSASGPSVQIRVAELTPLMVVGTGDHRFAMGFNDSYLIRVFDKQAREIFSFSSYRKPGTISQETKLQWFSHLIGKVTIGGQSGDYFENMIKSLPSTATAFIGIGFTPDNWLIVYTPREDRSHGRDIDLFNPAGTYQYRSRITLPEGETIVGSSLTLQDDRLYALCENEEGDIRLLAFSVSLPR